MANQHETGALDVCTPPVTSAADSQIENGKMDNGKMNEDIKKVVYTLKPTKRAFASTARLNLQHYLWKDQTGYLLHPSIPLSGIENLKIADVGTGTGIWLLDLARTLPPTTQLDGFDIDIADCPHEKWLPRNVTMRPLDALGEIPEELVGMYDVVQLRLFQVVVKDGDPGPLLQNMLRMLKPGGYLQWAEYDMTSHTTIKATPSLSSSALEAIPAFVQGFKKKDARVGSQNWIPLLPHTFHTHHLTHITASRHPTAPAFLQHQLDIFLLTYEELASKTLDKMPATDGIGNDGMGHGDKLRQMIEAASQEGSKGVGWGMDRLVVVGRKPEGVVMDEGDGDGDEKDGAAESVAMGGTNDLPGARKQQAGGQGAVEAEAEAGAGAATLEPSSTKAEASPAPAPAPPTDQDAPAKRSSRRASLLKLWKRMSLS